MASRDSRGTEAFVLEAGSRGALLERCEDLRDLLDRTPEVDLHDLAGSVNRRLGSRGFRLGLVGSSPADLSRKIGQAARHLRDPGCDRIRDRGGVYFSEHPLGHDGTVAFLFPGEGSQYPGMLADLRIRFREVGRWFDLVDRAFLGHGRGYLPSQVVFPFGVGEGGVVDQSAAADGRLWQMDVGPEVIFAASQALLAILTGIGVQPAALAGHSTGDLSALTAAGVLGRTDDDRLVSSIRALNGLYEEAQADGLIPRGVLLAVGGGTKEQILAVAERQGRLYLAMDNCPHQIVLCGDGTAMAAAAEELRARGSICTALPFQRAYHTPLFAQFAQRWAELHRHTTFRAPEIDLYSCATASRYPFEPEAIRRLAAEQWARPVRFRETVEAMYAAGVRIFVEVGPKGILTGFVRDILRGRPHAAVASNLPHRSGMSQLNHLVAELGAHGIPLKLGHWYDRTPPAVPPEKGAAGVTPGWPDPGSGSDTSRVMREYLATMERFLDLQEEFMRSYLRRAAPALSASPAPPLPFGGPIVSMTPGVELVMQRALDPGEDLFLRDHTLGGRVSGADEGLLALPVLPLTMSMEILAEAAATLVPGKVVLGMREVRASSWLALDDGPLVLTVGAHLAQEGEVLVRIWPQAGGGDGRHTAPAVEGTVLLGEAPPRACAPQMDGPRVTHPSRWTPDALYGEFMFHGPAFQAVTSIRHSDQRGMEAVLTALSAEGLFRSSPAPQLLALPVLLDAAGQLVGFWTAEHQDRAAHVFPFRVEGLQIFGPAPPPGTLVTCRAAISRVGEWELRTDMELIGPGGDLLVRIDGWWDKRFDLPEPLYRLGSSPRDHAVATPVPLPPEAGPSACSLVDAFGPELLESHGRIWQRVLAHLILGRNEREVWNRLPGSQERRSGWLLGRAAAKDAVRRLLLQSRGIVAYPAEIEITNDRNGRPEARGPWCAALDEPLFVSLAHAGGLAVALAVLGGGRPGVGIDLERVRPLAEGFDGVAFAPEEHAILSAVDPADETQWRVRLWCAKEAVGKALGTGLADGPRRLVVRHCDLVTGCVEVEPAQAAPSAGRPHGLVALTTCADGLAMALCLGRAPADV